MSRLAQTRMRMQQLAKGAGAKGGGKEGGDSNSSGGNQAAVANTGTEATQTGSPESAATRQRMQADARGDSSGAVASAPATGGDTQTDPVGDSVETTPSDAHSDARSDQASKAADPAGNKMRKFRDAATYTGRFASAFAVIAAQHAIANSRFGRSAIQTVKTVKISRTLRMHGGARFRNVLLFRTGTNNMVRKWFKFAFAFCLLVVIGSQSMAADVGKKWLGITCAHKALARLPPPLFWAISLMNQPAFKPRFFKIPVMG
jgi:hypothetical protein